MKMHMAPLLVWLSTVGCVVESDVAATDPAPAPATEPDPGTVPGTEPGTQPDTEPDAVPLAACAGEHEGVYDGDSQGIVFATLQPDGELLVTFVDFVEIDVSGSVSADGDVSGQGLGIRIDGDYDLDDCSATGTWNEIGGSESGDWIIDHL